MHTAPKQTASTWLWVGLVTPIVLFYGILARFLTSIPIEDDYNGLLVFILHWGERTSWTEHIQLIFVTQYNEYKMFLEYALFGSDMALTKHIHIGFWAAVGNLFALCLLVPMWLSCVPEKPQLERLALFLPVVWIVMNLGYWETLDWALSTMQVVSVSFFCLACVYLATRESGAANLWSCAFAMLACATYANGFFLAPIGVVLFVSRRRWTALFVWCVSYVIMLMLFLYGYHPVPHPSATALSYMGFFLALAGDIGFRGVYVPAAILGFFVLAAFSFATWKQLYRDQPFAYWSAVWVLLGFLTTAFGRASNGPGAALAARYKIYSHILFAVLYLVFLPLVLREARSPKARRRAYTAALCAAILFGFANDGLGYFQLKRRHSGLVYGWNAYFTSGGIQSPENYGPYKTHPFRPVDLLESTDVLSRTLQHRYITIPAHP